MTLTTRSSLLLFALAVCAAHAQQAVTLQTVQTEGGAVVGRQSSVSSFKGIPYAAPPVGELRWKPPQTAAAGTSPRDASQFGSVCTQIASGLFEEPKGTVQGNEDCLYLNVYAPKAASSSAKLPVMVWIHGGGFTSGAGSEYDPSVLVEKHGIVAVTLNYRLGSLGFLALPGLNAESAQGSSGNYGILDQQAALGWVQRNIARFGGNPADVTIAGESAGGMSVCGHLASPLSSGLFQKAIIQSGLCSSPNNTVTLAEASNRNLKYAVKLGCKTGDMACLRRVSAAKIAGTKVSGVRGAGNLVWSPVYRSSVLPLTLADAFAQGKFNRVPVLGGSNHDEGRLFISLIAPRGKPVTPVLYWGGSGLLVGVAKNGQVLGQYPYRNYGTPALAFATVFTDAMFSCPALNVASALSKYVPVYQFEFNDPKAVTSLKSPSDLPGLGAFHSSGLVYAFQTPLVGLADPAQFSPQQRQLSDAFSLAWVNFIKSGNPSSQNSAWKPFDPAVGSVQSFSPGGVTSSTTFSSDHKCAFWTDLNLK